MPISTFDAPLPLRPNRILVAGTSGSGKSALAKRIQTATDLPYVELDGLYHGPDWTPRPTFIDEVDQFSADPRWVTEWQYRLVKPMLLARADLMVWLDPPTWRVMRQVTRRTISRARQQSVLWNGNVEPPLHTIFIDRDHIIRWSWRNRHKIHRQVGEITCDHPGFPIVHLRSHDEAAAWLNGPLAVAAG